ncbi:DUF5641 domain-containing protein [Trichonephila clavipes]|nr:DUF5641 domain-containing protein [Trichonephila clavipes]
MDYLSNLQNRTKWKSPNHNIKVGEIVIIKEDNIPPATWPLGKVIETHPGKDGVEVFRKTNDYKQTYGRSKGRHGNGNTGTEYGSQRLNRSRSERAVKGIEEEF